MKNKKYLLLLLSILSVILIVLFSFKSYYPSKNKYNNINTKTVTYEEENIYTNKIEELQQENNNNDIKAIIKIDNIIDDIVVQSTNNEYYLNHNYKKQQDKLGAIYADYRINLDNSKKVLIFGHSSTKKDTPFNKLENYYDEYFYKNHKYIILQTETNIYKYST